MAASNWNPTTLVNTESFQTIDEGDSSTNIEIRFGQTLNEKLFYDRTNGRFEFSKGLVINGNTKVRGNLSGTTLQVDGASTLGGAVTHSNTTTLNGVTTANANVKVRGNLSGSTLTIDQLRNCDTIDTDASGNLTCGTDSTGITQSAADARYVNQSGDTMTGALNISNSAGLNASGTILTNTNLTINSDNGAANAVLTFGNATLAQTITYSHANQRFEFSKDIKVTGGVRASGNLSGATLNVDGTFTWRGQAYNGPTSQTANGFLKTDGAGNLTWTTSVGNGSGNVLSLHPDYKGATYFSSGSTAVGTLTRSYDTTNTQNYYEWTTSKATLQDYWLAVRLQVPKNFSHFETASGMTLRLRTTSTSAANNYITVRLIDTEGSTVALTGNTQLKSASANTWVTRTVGGVSTGTYTPGGYITILIKTAALTANVTDLGNIDLNWANTTP